MSHRDPNIFVHFRSDEKPFIERALDWIERSIERYQPVTTPFLDPRERTILQTLVQREAELIMLEDGGFESAERCRVVLGPPYVNEGDELFQLAFLRIESVSKKKLKHPHVLGALLGLGIKREKVGDLIPHDLGCDVVLAEELYQFVQLQLGQVGRDHVTIIKIAREELVLPEQRRISRAVTVASLRVDAVVAEGFKQSRSKASTLIKGGKCKVNWKCVDQPDYSVEVGDIISIRGYGRICVERIDGLTKKGRFLIHVSSWS